MDENPQHPQWVGPRFDLNDGHPGAPSFWKIVRRFVGLGVLVGSLVLAAGESFRWVARQPRPKAPAGQVAANPPAAAPQPAIPDREKGNVAADEVELNPFAEADAPRRQAEAFQAEARKRHGQALADMHLRLEETRRRHEAFRENARKRHNDLLRRHGMAAPFDDGARVLIRVE